MTHTVDATNSHQTEHVPPAQVPENMVDWMVNTLAEKGHPEPRAWIRLLKPGMEHLADPDYQMYEINRAWRAAFAETVGKSILTPEESMNTRYAIIDKCPAVNWKQAFVEGVLPCILRHNLPLNK
jgi:hypothetical protein